MLAESEEGQICLLKTMYEVWSTHPQVIGIVCPKAELRIVKIWKTELFCAGLPPSGKTHGPSCLKLMVLLVNGTLKFQMFYKQNDCHF